MNKLEYNEKNLVFHPMFEFVLNVKFQLKVTQNILELHSVAMLERANLDRFFFTFRRYPIDVYFLQKISFQWKISFKWLQRIIQVESFSLVVFLLSEGIPLSVLQKRSNLSEFFSRFDSRIVLISFKSFCTPSNSSIQEQI